MSRFSILLIVFLGPAIATPNDSDEGRIIGGSDVPLGLAPYMASLRSLRDVHFCGGTILSNRFVLTSAQCVIGRVANSINVVVGTVNRNVAGATYVSSVLYTHPRFNHKTLANDSNQYSDCNSFDEPNNLQRITTRTISNEECRLKYGSQSWRVNNQKVCTSLTADKGTCYGDEGSAIVLDQELIGVASWHSHCYTGLPDMYERILPHRLWIRSITG